VLVDGRPNCIEATDVSCWQIQERRAGPDVRRLRVRVAGEALAKVDVDALEKPRVIELGTGVPPERRGVKIRPVGASISMLGTAREVPDGSPARRSS